MIEFNVSKKLHTANGSRMLHADVRIETGSFITLSGESGCGKTTLIKLLAGLITPDEGRITYNGKCWFDSEKKINVKTFKRDIGFAFQDYVLFPNLSVRENIFFGSTDDDFAEQLLDIMQLRELAERLPEKLSGGQKQRTALARALARQAGLLLLDEPLSALDGKMRCGIQNMLKTQHIEQGNSIILITHDAEEIRKLSTQSIIIGDGKIIFDGSPEKHISQAIEKTKEALLHDTENNCVENINYLKLVK